MISINSEWMDSNAKMFAKKKCVIITGAGISCNSGIPDFRSTNGIFNEIRETLKIKGTDLFSYRYSVEPKTRDSYLKFIGKLKEMVDNAEPSYTHTFFKKFKKYAKKLRIYTQNIDGLEEKGGLISNKEDSTEIVYLHGNMKHLVCNYCGYKLEYNLKINELVSKAENIECVKCIERKEKRIKENKRSVPVGIMCTNIIHYNQPHPESNFISKIVEADKDCNLVIVMGTSLKVYGIKKLVKYFLRCNDTGKNIFVNFEEPNKEFKDLFDFHWKGDCDEFCRNIAKYVMKEDSEIETKKEKAKTKEISKEILEEKKDEVKDKPEVKIVDKPEEMKKIVNEIQKIVVEDKKECQIKNTNKQGKKKKSKKNSKQNYHKNTSSALQSNINSLLENVNTLDLKPMVQEEKKKPKVKISKKGSLKDFVKVVSEINQNK